MRLRQFRMEWGIIAYEKLLVRKDFFMPNIYMTHVSFVLFVSQYLNDGQ